MYKQVEYLEKNKNRSSANLASQEKTDGKHGFVLVDNRPMQPLQFVVKNNTKANVKNPIIESNVFQRHGPDIDSSERQKNFTKDINPVQRFISTYAIKKKHEPATDDQLESLVEEYLRIKGKGREEQIRDVIERLKSAPGWYCLNDVRKHLQKIDPDRVFFNNVFQDDTDRPLLPTGSLGEVDVIKRRQAIKNFSFTSVTTLVAQVVLSDETSFKVELRNISDLKNISGSRENRGHAEMLLLRQIDLALSKKEVEPERITITINNSPCEYCTDDIIDWAGKYEKLKMIIHYVNPFGAASRTLDQMNDAGISVFPYSVLADVGSETDDELSQSDGVNYSAKEKFQYFALKASAVESERKKARPKEIGFQIKSESNSNGENMGDEEY